MAVRFRLEFFNGLAPIECESQQDATHELMRHVSLEGAVLDMDDAGALVWWAPEQWARILAGVEETHPLGKISYLPPFDQA